MTHLTQQLASAALVIAVATTTACTHPQPLSTLPDHLGETVDVTLHGGREVDAILEHDGSHAVLRGEDGNIIPRDQVDTIVGRSSGRGALEGLGLGLLVGGAIGVTAGFADGDDPESDWIRFSAGDKALIFGLALGGVGGLIGALAGAAVGSKNVFTLGPRVTPVGPPGSTAGVSVAF